MDSDKRKAVEKTVFSTCFGDEATIYSNRASGFHRMPWRF